MDAAVKPFADPTAVADFIAPLRADATTEKRYIDLTHSLKTQSRLNSRSRSRSA